jgi:hypothetical protein
MYEEFDEYEQRDTEALHRALRVLFWGGLIAILFAIMSCVSSGSIHNQDLQNRRREMLRQDKVMKKKMQTARKHATPRRLRNKTSRVKRKYI